MLGTGGEEIKVVTQTHQVEPNYYLVVNENHCGNSAADNLFCFLIAHEKGTVMPRFARVRSNGGKRRVIRLLRTANPPACEDGDPEPQDKGQRRLSFLVHPIELALPPRLASC